MKQLTMESSKAEKTRRSCSRREEEILIACLKDMVASRWKVDNGFKVGNLNVLEQHMTKAFPGTDLRATPYIHSKIHVWKGTMEQYLQC